jgi:tetratricopeptide (TPR) repeat protein
MKPSYLTVAVFVSLGWSPAATAAPPRGFQYGWSETIVPVCDLPPEVRAGLKKDTNHDLAVGFCYRHAFLIGEEFNFWTWDGKYVLFENNLYYNLTDEQFVQLLGKEKFDSLGKPFAYRIPVGLLTTIVIALVIGAAIYRSAPMRMKRLLKDNRYQQALQIYSQHLPNDREATPEEKKSAIAAGIAYLQCEHNIAPKKAETDFLIILAEFDRVRSYDLRNQAAVYEQDQQWERAIDYYEQAAELRKDWDRKDYKFLLKCVDRVRSKEVRYGKE